MSLYPSLEDMKVDQMQHAQQQYAQAAHATAHAIAAPEGSAPPAYGAPPEGSAPPAYGTATPPGAAAPTGKSSLYPSLDEYMGLSFTPEMISQTMPVVAANSPQNMQVGTRQTSTGQMQVAPITGSNQGVQRAEIKQGVREVLLCKDQAGKVGLRVKAINKGVFVALVHVNSPAALAGLRFGDQILQIDGNNVAGWDTDKTMKVISKAASDRISMAIRDRPFERTITMQKDSTGHIGFVFKDGKITSLVVDSSAARNGVLIEHQLVEVNGQNVVGMKDTDVAKIIGAAPRTVTITVLPTFVYEHIIRSMGSSLMKKFMDHSVPDV